MGCVWRLPRFKNTSNNYTCHINTLIFRPCKISEKLHVIKQLIITVNKKRSLHLTSRAANLSNNKNRHRMEVNMSPHSQRRGFGVALDQANSTLGGFERGHGGGLIMFFLKGIFEDTRLFKDILSFQTRVVEMCFAFLEQPVRERR